MLGLGPGASLVLGFELFGGLPDPLPPPAVIPQISGHPIRALIATTLMRCSVLGPVRLLGLGDYADQEASRATAWRVATSPGDRR